MPIISNSRGRSRGYVDQVPKGWGFIQETILSQDEDMIADYADDIDTLLVFAGLFSAVLTAFLVVSLVLLQPDNSRTSIELLSLIALQNGAPTSMRPFLNETAESLSSATTFRAATNAVTINTLWFTSLVLSLAAALLGILAKQWCREYLRWHRVVASARENVLIRQTRYEAWHQWRVTAFIALIPAILELALVLFLLGLPILVHTFSERTLTVVVSVVIGGALVGAVVLTILPLFYRSCPFKTPTGGAFVLFAGPLRPPFWYIINRICSAARWFCWHVIRSVHEPAWLASLRLHSRTMLASVRAEELHGWRAYSLYPLEDSELCKSAVQGIDSTCREMRVTVNRWNSFPLPQAAVDAVQTRVLTRALSWVLQGSNDDTVLSAILEALRSIHTTRYSVIARNVFEKADFLASIHAMCPTDLSLACQVARLCFRSSPAGCLSFRLGPQSPFRLFDLRGPFIDAVECTGLERQLRGGYQAVCKAWAHDAASVEVCHALVRSDIFSLVDDWLRHVDDDDARRIIAERIALLLSLLRIMPSPATVVAIMDTERRLTRLWARTMEDIFNELAPHPAAYINGLVPMCVELSRLIGPVTFGYERGRCRMIVSYDSVVDLNYVLNEFFLDRECNRISTWAILATDIYHKSGHYKYANARHLFVALTSRVFETVRLRITYTYDHTSSGILDGSTTPMAELLVCMVDALRWSLIHDQPNCGAYTALPWVEDISQCYQAVQDLGLTAEISGDPLRAVPFTGDPSLRPTFLLALRLLQACLERGLLIGATIAGDLERLLEFMSPLGIPELPTDLTIESSEAQRIVAPASTSRQTLDNLPGNPEHVELPGEVSESGENSR